MAAGRFFFFFWKKLRLVPARYSDQKLYWQNFDEYLIHFQVLQRTSRSRCQTIGSSIWLAVPRGCSGGTMPMSDHWRCRWPPSNPPSAFDTNARIRLRSMLNCLEVACTFLPAW
uniref:Hypothetical secreted protein 1025 n=1 Tax=Amblyomma variegatum TaxID=34610 RepID=F0J9S0_AMBVA|nr:TPA_inf: hypothetical secreted protein 1025 [Amblyomma variegatum]